MPTKKRARFQCLRCGAIFVADTGPVKCRECRHLYLEWLNFDRLFGREVVHKKGRRRR